MNKQLLALLLSILFFTLDTPLFSQDFFEPAAQPVSYKPNSTNQLLRIDGKLDELEWKNAKTIGPFTQIDPNQGAKATQRTDVKIMFNTRYLYVGVFCFDSLGKKSIRIPDFQRDFAFSTRDVFGMSIDGFRDKRNSMAFVMDPYGTQRDLLSFDATLFDPEWDGLWQVRTSRTDSGWVAEVAIPWQTLRYPKSKDSTQTWGLNFVRNRRLTNEVTAWSPMPRMLNPLRMEYAGQLVGIKPPPPSPNVRIQPYFLLTDDRYNGSDFANLKEGTIPKIGGEVKWAINPNTVLDLTFNTDFAQADADRQVNNVTRFSIFFPERRQFFLENASLFSVGLYPIEDLAGGPMRIVPFFSRSIGLNNGTPIPIDAGARLVYRSLERNAGILAIRQRGVDGLGGTNFVVGRFSENIGKQNRIGFIGTLKNAPEGNNYVGALDAFIRITPTISWSSMGIFSQTTGHQTDRGASAYSQFSMRGNNLVSWLVNSYVSADFNPALGFVSRKDVFTTSTGGYYVYLNQHKKLPAFVRTFEPGFYAEFYHQASTGILTERQININPIWLNLQSGGGGGLFINRVYQNLTEVFDPVNIRINPGEYHYTRFNVFLLSDRSKKLSYLLNHERGNYYDGTLASTEFTLNFSPRPQISLQASIVNNDFENVGVNRETRNVRIVGGQMRLALNPRVQLIGFYQKNNFDNRDIWNLRLSWEYQPLSFVYVVFNARAYDQLIEDPNKPNSWIGDRYIRGLRQNEQHLIAKISFLKQF
jgi:Domain of unknown function (DUF5916)/Carbohydrate family 9 binding domain-like